jgi:hypothetical protein
MLAENMDYLGCSSFLSPVQSGKFLQCLDTGTKICLLPLVFRYRHGFSDAMLQISKR